ncbi:MAG: ABC transporter ATP-binding protein, partial [Proteobacteria bacterium]|nr:ABC transporter ATP-binding protein [Pseudomonadota bacterium]
MSAPDGSSAPTAIVAKNLTKRFDDENDAVKNISFTVPQGSITALLGGNGAGKTTTLSMILGILTPTSGNIAVLGIDMAHNRSQALPFMNFSSPYVGLPMRLTVNENLIVYANLYGLDRVKERVAKITEELGLEDFRKQPVGKLSAGEKSRVALAKALINEPAVLLLDEPTASMDPDTADWIRNYFDRYRNRTGATIFMASHNMREVERLCDDTLIMQRGE